MLYLISMLVFPDSARFLMLPIYDLFRIFFLQPPVISAGIPNIGRFFCPLFTGHSVVYYIRMPWHAAGAAPHFSDLSTDRFPAVRLRSGRIALPAQQSGDRTASKIPSDP